jgi:hypothetical protein
MPTPFTDVYDFFLAKITDYDFIAFTESEIEDEFERYLRSAVPKFFSAGSQRLTRNYTTKEFNLDLTDLEKEIISTLMLVEYLNPKIIATENMKQFLASREYKIYSQANHLAKMIELKNQIRAEVNHLMTNYSYQDGIAGMD